MNLRKFVVAFVGTVLLLTCNIVLAANNYVLDDKISRVTFATIKKQYVVEPAEFKLVSGSLTSSGKLSAIIDLTSVNTNVGIRDQRLKDIFFQTKQNSKAKVSATLDMKAIKKRGPVKRLTFDVTVEYRGKSKTYKADAFVTKSSSRLVFTNVLPIIVSMNDFGIPQANLEALAKTVGGIPLSGTVPLGFALVFKN